MSVTLFLHTGFAVNIDLILKHSNVTINPLSRTGWLESDFLTQLISPNDVRGGADNCMKVIEEVTHIIYICTVEPL